MIFINSLKNSNYFLWLRTLNTAQKKTVKKTRHEGYWTRPNCWFSIDTVTQINYTQNKNLILNPTSKQLIPLLDILIKANYFKNCLKKKLTSTCFSVRMKSWRAVAFVQQTNCVYVTNAFVIFTFYFCSWQIFSFFYFLKTVCWHGRKRKSVL